METLSLAAKQWICAGELCNVINDYQHNWELGDQRNLNVFNKMQLLSDYLTLSNYDRDCLTQSVQNWSATDEWDTDIQNLFADITDDLSGIDPNHLDTFEFFWKLWEINESTLLEPYCSLLYGNELSETDLVEYVKYLQQKI